MAFHFLGRTVGLTWSKETNIKKCVALENGSFPNAVLIMIPLDLFQKSQMN